MRKVEIATDRVISEIQRTLKDLNKRVERTTQELSKGAQAARTAAADTFAKTTKTLKSLHNEAGERTTKIVEGIRAKRRETAAVPGSDSWMVVPPRAVPDEAAPKK